MRFNAMSAAGMLTALLSTIGLASTFNATPSRGVEAPFVAPQPAGAGPALVAGTTRQAGRGPQPKTVPDRSNGPWTYLGTMNGGAVLIDMASIRRAGGADDGGYVEAWAMLTDGNGADVWMVDIDCELKAHRIRHLVREDAERNTIFQAPDAGSWGNTNPGATFDRLATIMCDPAALPAVSSDGPWTYVAIFDGRSVFYDEASIRRDTDEEGRDYIAVRTLVTEADGALLATLDTDCAAGVQRVGDIVQEDAMRKRTDTTDGVSEWGEPTRGKAGDRIRKLVCGAAGA